MLNSINVMLKGSELKLRKLENANKFNKLTLLYEYFHVKILFS